MAKQKGTVLLTGPLGNISFYKDPNDGFLARQKGGPDRERIFRDPHFKRTLENASDFSRTIRGGTALRFALAAQVKHVADGKLNGRMNGVLTELIRSDNTHVRGEKCLANGQLSLLEKLDFNKDALLDRAFPVAYQCGIDTATGNMYVDIPSFIPKAVLLPAPGATHFAIETVGTAMDFVNKTPRRYEATTPLFPIDHQPVDALRLEQQVPPEAGKALILAMCIVFYTLPKSIPRDLLSKRKRNKLGNGDSLVAYTGAMRVVKTALVPESHLPAEPGGNQ